MKKLLLFMSICLLLAQNSFATAPSERINPDSINDGPYIYKVNNKLRIKWIENGLLREAKLTPENFPKLKKTFNLLFSYDDLIKTFSPESDFTQSFKRIDSIGIISDVHGQYSIYLNLLKAMGIIDNKLNWNFGKGHLVVIGDIFDRGDMVTEAMWHLYGLEKQALKAGGMVHVLLGNHETLVLGHDLRYINEKYKMVEEICHTTYCDMYSEHSVLGKWLRSKPVMIKIDNILFVHAGISSEMAQRNLKISMVNELFTDSIVGKTIQSTDEKQVLNFLNDNDGPLWYRGYFTDKRFRESQIDSILHFYNTEHIVVGHTFNKDIKSIYNNKIIGIDAGIMYELPGEMLMYKNGTFYKGFVTGERIKM